MCLGFIREKQSFADAVHLFLINFVFCTFVMFWPTWPWEKGNQTKLKSPIARVWGMFILTLTAVVLFALVNYTKSLWSLLADVVSRYYANLTARLGLGFLHPAVFLTVNLGAQNYLFRRAQFAVVSTRKNLLGIYLTFMAMAYCFGIPAVMRLYFFTWIHLYNVTSATRRGQTWSVKYFAAWACMMSTSPLFSTVWNIIIFFSMSCVVSWLDDKYHTATHSRTDEGKNVRTLTGQKFVKQRSTFFLWLFALTGLITIVGQLHVSTSSIAAPETISNVFCKTDNQSQLECLVNVTYYNPAEPDTKKCFCETRSPGWDFCGSFTFYCWGHG